MTENSIETPTYDVYWKKKLKSPKDISYSRDGNHLLVGSTDGRIYLYTKDGTELWNQNLNDLTSLDISADSSKIIVGNHSGLLILLSKDGNREWDKKINGSINSLSISDDGKNICVGTEKGIIIDYNNDGNELWKHKINGTSDGGICHSPDGKFIVVGSWDTVHYLSVEGKFIWKYKFGKKITDVSVAENYLFIAASTKDKIGFVGINGNLISEIAINDGFKSLSICDNIVFAVSSNNTYIFNNKGEQKSLFETPENLSKIQVISKEFVSAISENRIYMFSSLLKPKINIITDSLIIGEKQTLKAEIINNSPKELEFELELRSNELISENFKTIVKIPTKGRSIAEYKVIPNKVGICNIDFFIKNKNIKPSKTIEIVPPKIQLDISHHPKYDFNAENDEITMIIDIENKGRVAANKICIEGMDCLSIPELKPKARGTLTYKTRLPSGNHNLSKKIFFENESGYRSNYECPCFIQVNKEPYVCSLKHPDIKIVNEKPAIVKFGFKNLKNDIVNLTLYATSEKIEINPNIIPVQLGPKEIKDVELTITPKESGESIQLKTTVEHNCIKQIFFDEIKVFPKPPHITIKNYMPKKIFHLGEDIYETLELKNDGEIPATNIKIEGILITPFLEAKASKVFNMSRHNNNIQYYKSFVNKIIFEDEFEEKFSAEFNSVGYTVESPLLNIRIPEIILEENVRSEIKVEIENISNETLKNVLVEVLINNSSVIFEKLDVNIESISPKSIKPVIFGCKANTEDVVEFQVCAKQNGIVVEKQIGRIIIGTRTPKLEFEIDDKNMIENNNSILKLTITNVGKGDARNITIKLLTELEKKLSKLELTSNDNPDKLEIIKPKESKEVTFDFQPTTGGKASLTILSSYKSIYGKNISEKKDQFSININPKNSGPNTVIYDHSTKIDGNVFGGDVVATNSQISSINKKINEPNQINSSGFTSIPNDNTRKMDGNVFGGDVVATSSNITSNIRSIQVPNEIETKDGKTQAANLLKSDITSLEEKIPKLEFQIDDGEMLQNNYSLLKLKITNNGKIEAKDINIRIQSEIDKKLSIVANQSNYSQLEIIKPLESKEITLGVHPTTAGKVSLTIIISCKSVHGKSIPETKEQAIVTIQPQDSKPNTIISFESDDIGDSVNDSVKDTLVQKSKLELGKSNQLNTKDSIIQRSSIGNSSTDALKKYRASCIKAFEDGKIIKEELEFLNNQAKLLHITDLEKKRIEDEIFESPNILDSNIETYRQQAMAVFNKGKITTEERVLLDVLRINSDMTKEQQKKIEDEIKEILSEKKQTVNHTTGKTCLNCGKAMQNGMFCAECGAKLT